MIYNLSLAWSFHRLAWPLMFYDFLDFVTRHLHRLARESSMSSNRASVHYGKHGIAQLSLVNRFYFSSYLSSTYLYYHRILFAIFSGYCYHLMWSYNMTISNHAINELIHNSTQYCTKNSEYFLPGYAIANNV